MSANVRSIEAIRDFRATVQKFAEEVEGALEAVQIELQRAFDWIEHDRPHYWQLQTRRGFDLVAQTRVALSTCQMRKVAGRQPSCIEEKQACAAAKRRLEHCQQQIERVKHWNVKIHHDANEFRGRMGTFQRSLGQELPKLIALLTRTIDVLERYADVLPSDGENTAPRERKPATPLDSSDVAES
ncbi:MAG: hypothetical protein R3B90_06335 [Planctomycetaceae bacterium]